MDSEEYYLAKRGRKLSLALLAGTITIAAIVWALAAGLCGHPVLCIVLAIAAAFTAFVTAIQLKDADQAHDRWLRAVVDPQPTNDQ